MPGARRDRNAGYPAPLAQIPACATNALGSCLRYERQSVGQGMGESHVFEARTFPRERQIEATTYSCADYGGVTNATTVGVS